MSNPLRNKIGAAAAIGVIAATAAIVGIPTANAATTPPGISVYQGKATGHTTVLGPQSAPSLLTHTATLPAGVYLVTATVGAVIAAHDQIVCSAFPGPGAHNDGVFGTAGNPGTGNIYGTAAITDTVRITTPTQIDLYCNAFNYGKGTYAGAAVVEAVPVAALH